MWSRLTALQSPSRHHVLIRNDGPEDATGVVLSDPLPDFCTFVSALTNQGKCVFEDSDLRCDIGTVPSGEEVRVTITCSPVRVGSFRSTATVSSDVEDPDPTNNSATAETIVRLNLAVSPTQGTVGSQIEIQGRNLGNRRGQVRLKGSKGTRPLKVGGWYEDPQGNGYVRAQVRRPMPPGRYALIVRPRGFSEVVEEDLYEIMPPQITESPSSATPGSELALTGVYLSSKKPKVRIEVVNGAKTKSVPCRVLSWPDKPGQGTTEGRIRFHVPRRVPAGKWMLVVRYRVGEDRAPIVIGD